MRVSAESGDPSPLYEYVPSVEVIDVQRNLNENPGIHQVACASDTHERIHTDDEVKIHIQEKTV